MTFSAPPMSQTQRGESGTPLWAVHLRSAKHMACFVTIGRNPTPLWFTWTVRDNYSVGLRGGLSGLGGVVIGFGNGFAVLIPAPTRLALAPRCDCTCDVDGNLGSTSR